MSPFLDLDDNEPDDFRSWCEFYDVDPEGPGVHGLYQDWLDESDRRSIT